MTVDEWSPAPSLRQGIDVVHVHWPEIALNIARPTRAAARTAEFLSGLAAARARGARVVWTAHNVRSHLQRRPRAERVFWPVMDRLVDGWIALSDASVTDVLAAHPQLASRPRVTTPHGHYRGAYSDTVSRRQARAIIGLPADARVACFVGRLRAYKGVDRLVTAFRGVADADARLLVAGASDEADLTRFLEKAAQADPRIHLHLQKVADDDLQTWLRAADLSVLPYVDVLHSGSAMLALSFDLPVLAPATGALPELAAAVPEWVRIYDGALSAETLRQALRSPAPTGRPDLSSFDWRPIAETTLELYERVARPRRASR